MKIFTPQEAAKQTGTKYRAVLVAAKFARMINEFPKDVQVQWDPSDREQKLTTLAMEKLVSGELGYREMRRRRSEV